MSLGTETVRDGRKAGGGELGDTNVHLAGADIQEYFVKNNSIFGGSCE